MSTVEKAIDVNAPVRTVYNQWTQFEDFPRFMDGVEEVRQLSDTKLHWIAEVGGRKKEWDATITEQVPDQRVAWRSESGDENGGVVTFHKLDGNDTRIMLQMAYEPANFVESIGDKLGFMSRRIEGDLDRFKKFLEARGQETGAWRGTVSQQ
jgi:uncharacterized membrane protein